MDDTSRQLEEAAAQQLESLVVEEPDTTEQPAPTSIPEDTPAAEDVEETSAQTGDKVADSGAEGVAIAPETMPDDDKLLTANDMAKLFPDVGAKSNPSQRFRNWAESAIKGGKGNQELANLGYEAVVTIGKDGKNNYFFRKLL